MSWLRDLFGIYARVSRRAATLTLRHWWIGLVAIVYLVAYTGVGMIVGGFGIVGGFIATLAQAAFVSSWLVLLEGVIRHGRVTPADIAGSFGVYLGDVVTFLFLLWVLRLVTGIAFADFAFVEIVFGLALLVFLSAVPEQIYLAHDSGAAIFVEGYRFVATYWVEWLPPIGLLFVASLAAWAIPVVPLAVVVFGLALAFMSIWRGLLYLELTTSSRRAREFQRRAMG
jgi:hypothetical protein